MIGAIGSLLSVGAGRSVGVDCVATAWTGATAAVGVVVGCGSGAGNGVADATRTGDRLTVAGAPPGSR